MFCEGQIVAIAENEPLFQLIGTTYRGDGQETFALPNLRGRIPVHQGNGFTLAETGGAEEVMLTAQQTPVHSHAALASSQGAGERNPANAVPGQALSQIYINDTPMTNLNPNSIGAVGGRQPHTNFQPYLCINFIISLFGIFPSPT